MPSLFGAPCPSCGLAGGSGVTHVCGLTAPVGMVPMPAPTLRLKTVPQDAWVLVERYVEHFPDDWRLIFRRGDDVLEVSVSEETWRAFDA